jgi:anti-sigma B factor antagonist
MALLLHVSNLENGILLRCEGRIVCGPESEELEKRVRLLLPAFRHVVLDLSHVTFVDSGGMGLLVRLMTSARSLGGDVKLAAPSPQIAKLLETTGLRRVFELFQTTEEALSASLGQGTGKRVLCVDPSCDVLTFVRTTLRAAGYAVHTTENLFDAKILLRASRPDLLVLGPNLDSARSQETLREYLPAVVLALDAHFDRLEAAEARAILLERVLKAAAA